MARRAAAGPSARPAHSCQCRLDARWLRIRPGKSSTRHRSVSTASDRFKFLACALRIRRPRRAAPHLQCSGRFQAHFIAVTCVGANETAQREHQRRRAGIEKLLQAFPLLERIGLRSVVERKARDVRARRKIGLLLAEQSRVQAQRSAVHRNCPSMIPVMHSFESPSALRRSNSGCDRDCPIFFEDPQHRARPARPSARSRPRATATAG